MQTIAKEFDALLPSKSTTIGFFGELITRGLLWLFLDGKKYRRFHNVIIPSESGTTQVDHLIVSQFGVFVIETKNMKGWIFGSEHQRKWTQCLRGGKFPFQNPLHQNYRHIKCLSEHFGLEEQYFHSVVFFIGECKFKTEMPPNVIRDGITGFIKSFKSTILEDWAIEAICDEFKALKGDKTLNKTRHLQSLKDRYTSEDNCPKCGSVLIRRTSKRGVHAGSDFLSCSAFPKCRFRRAVSDDMS